MAKIINGRVRQKAAPLAEWQNSDLESLDGEQLFVRSDVDDAVIGFKFGAKGKTFSELPYPDLTVRDKATPSMSWSGRQSGVYIPTTNGNYNGVNVNLTEGYQVLYWDGDTVQKVVYPTDYTGAIFGGVIDDTYDLSTPPTDPTWYIASAGTYNTTPPTTLTETSILTWNGQSWSHIPFELEIRGEFLVADNIEEVRNITPEVAQLLVNGTYKGVTVLGYYEPGDTPEPINYYLSDTTDSDDGGSVLEGGGIKLEHNFGDGVDARYFGLFPLSTKPTLENFTTQQVLWDKIRDYCIDNGKDFYWYAGDYALNLFRTGYAVDKMKINIIGIGRVNVYLKYSSTPTMVQIWDDAYMENIYVYSLEPDLNNQRASTENRKNIYLKNCGFFDFKAPSTDNAWGMYMKNSTNITLDGCEFGNNGQSDIAIVDGCNDITIINPKNSVDTGVYLNIEPNTNIINRNIKLQGGRYRRLNLLTNTITENPIQAMSVIGCEIDWLMYDGGDADFIGTEIKSITNQDFVTVPMGALDLNLRFGGNLIKDPYMVDYDYSSTDRQWLYSFASNLQTSRVNQDFTRIGNRASTGTVMLKTQPIEVDVTKKYLFMVNGRGNYYGTISNISRFCRIKLYDASMNPITITKPVAGVPTNFDYIAPSAFRFTNTAEGSTGFINQIGVLEFQQYAPTTKYITIEIGKYASNSNEYDIKFLSLNEITSFEKGESISSYVSRNITPSKYLITGTPPNNAIANRTLGFKTGDVLYNSIGNVYYVTDGSVRPSVTKDILAEATTSTLGSVRKGVHVPDGSSIDTLLSSLRNAGVIALS